MSAVRSKQIGIPGAAGSDLPRSARGVGALLTEIAACRLCADAMPVEPRPVLQVDRRARILLAGQAPGRRVHESGVPFSDPSGERLCEWLGISADELRDPKLFAIVPMGFCYPGSSRSGDLPPRRECAPAWRERVLATLDRVELSVVVGRHATAYHLPKFSGVTAAVAEWRTHAPDVFALPHPSPRNAHWLTKNPWFERELLPVLRRRVRRVIAAEPSTAAR